MTRAAYLSALACLLLLPTRAVAQAPPPLDSGQIIHVRTATRTEQGRMLAALAISDSILTYCLYPARPCTDSSGTRRTLPLSTIVALDRRTGSRWREGAFLGTVIGTGLGLLAHSFAEGLCDTPDCVPSYTTSVLLPGLLFGGLGAAFGDSRSVWAPVTLGASPPGRLPN